jgi:2-polyprenyl-3-methyl-5-hydroxy-6-metoxy-1,4-benzoquinol methylase
MLKSLVVETLARAGIRVHRVPKLKHRINPAVDELRIEDILRVVKEEYGKTPDARPSLPDSLHYLSRRRFSFYCDTLDLIEEHHVPIADRRVLEIGAFFGVLLQEMHRRYPTARLCGAECVPIALAVAHRLCPQADLRCETLATLSFDGLFDLVVLMEVLEHLVDPYSELERLDSLVAPGGTLFVTVPNGRYDSMMANVFVPERQSYTGHVNFWSPESWLAFVQHVLPGRSVLTGTMPPRCLFALIRKE